MKTIPLTRASVEKIQAEIDAVQAGCRRRLLDADDLLNIAVAAEKRLDDLGVTQRERFNARVHYNPWGVPNSYGVSPAQGTYAVMRRATKGWTVVEVGREDVWGTRYGTAQDWRIELDSARADLGNVGRRVLRNAGLAA